MANPEKTAMDYAMLFAVGIIGMFVAHLLGFLVTQATSGASRTLPYWWGYPLVFPALASVWIHWKRSFWLGTAIVVCLAPVIYFTWYAANSVPSSLGSASLHDSLRDLRCDDGHLISRREAGTSPNNMTTRRDFLSGLASAGFATTAVFRPTAIGALFRANVVAGDRAADQLADDEAYWSEIQRAFDSDRTMINLNNGGCSPTPSHVLEAMIRDLRFSNELPVEHMWRVLEPRVESVRRDLAQDFGCDPEEMAITRNASEANEIMIFGLDLKRGDEVVVTNQNYGRMITAWQQRERRDGIVLKQVSFKVRRRRCTTSPSRSRRR